LKPSKKTITTPNRFITFTQSWLAKASLLFLFLAFIFFSCGDDLSTIGFKPDENRFKVAYAEIDLPSAVYKQGPLITSNRGGDNLTPRLLVGSYLDEKFGRVTAEAYMQIRPYIGNPTFTGTSSPNLPDGATLESLVLNLSFDYYQYGSSAISNINFYVHEVTDSLITEQVYYNNSSVDYSPSPIGVSLYGIDPTAFTDKYNRKYDGDVSNDNLNELVQDTLSINLGRAYAESLFAAVRDNADSYNFFRKFRRQFKGLVVRSDAFDKIVGFNPSFTPTTVSPSNTNTAGMLISTNNVPIFKSRLVLYYNFPDPSGTGTKRGKVEFALYADPSGYGAVSFSKIKAERAGSALQSIDQFYKDFYPDGDNRFVQSGDPITTKFDISNFFSFADTVSNMLINSAELVIDPIDGPAYTPPNTLLVRVLNTKNHFLTLSDTLSAQYTGVIVPDKDGYLVLGEGVSTSAVVKKMGISSSDGIYRYRGSFTRYFQTIYALKDSTQWIRYHSLVPGDPLAGHSTNRLVFAKDKLKLRIYYTTPSTKKE